MTSSPFFSRLRTSAALILDFRFLAAAVGAERTFRRSGIVFFFDVFTFESPWSG